MAVKKPTYPTLHIVAVTDQGKTKVTFDILKTPESAAWIKNFRANYRATITEIPIKG